MFLKYLSLYNFFYINGPPVPNWFQEGEEILLQKNLLNLPVVIYLFKTNIWGIRTLCENV